MFGVGSRIGHSVAYGSRESGYFGNVTGRPIPRDSDKSRDRSVLPSEVLEAAAEEAQASDQSYPVHSFHDDPAQATKRMPTEHTAPCIPALSDRTDVKCTAMAY